MEFSIAESFLHELAQGLEIRRRVSTLILTGFQGLQKMPDVDAHDQGIEPGQLPRHVDHTQVPATIPGNEQHNLIGLGRRHVEDDFSETAKLQRGFGNSARSPAEARHRQQEPDPDELSKKTAMKAIHEDFPQRLNTPLTPPAIRAATSSRTVGRPRPPGATRYLGRHTGENLFL